MSLIGRRGSKKRPGYAGRTFISQPTPHGIVAKTWPPPRGRPKTLWARSIQNNLSQVTGFIGRLNDREVDPLRQALIELNLRNQGLRGSASIRLEDLLTQHGFGRLFAYRLPDGRVLYSRNAVNDVSRRLDWLEPMVGSMLTRTPTGWLPTNACAVGAKMRLMPSIPIEGCCPPASVFPNTV